MKTITGKNHFRHGDPAGPRPTAVELSEDTQVEASNLSFARVTNAKNVSINGVPLEQAWVPGEFDLAIVGCNTLGLRINTVKIDDYATSDGEPLQLAVDILAVAESAMGEDGVDAWLWTCGWLSANPEAAYAEWVDAYETWAAEADNAIKSSVAFTRIRDRFWPEEGFAAVRDATTAHDLETWHGGDTQNVEVIT